MHSFVQNTALNLAELGSPKQWQTGKLKKINPSNKKYNYQIAKYGKNCANI
jgi:hypothetical protein